ncbi:MAG TPA: hypothetical protein VJG32_00290 [Anaerolineae bacterium]|nr:hypothetical protein [Anaerolineae bacterium]
MLLLQPTPPGQSAVASLELVALAALIGGIGSLAYATALLYGFVVNEELLKRFLPASASGGPLKALRVIWFALIGAGVAAVFQLPQTTSAPIQAFIIGTTWPSVVSQVLTGRQSGALTPEPSNQIIKNIQDELDRRTPPPQDTNLLAALIGPEPDETEAKG